MRPSSIIAVFSLLVFTGCAAPAQEKEKQKVSFPAGIDHAAWDALLKQHVNAKGLVSYKSWKNSAKDMQALDAYLQSYAKEASPAAEGDEMVATAINAYNAFAVKTILENYPVESIQEIKDAFSKENHDIGGQKVSLDDIEHGTLRPAIGYRAHAVLVCCARSCPPLATAALSAGSLDAQIDKAYTVWLGRDDLNKYFPEEKKVKISTIFKWFSGDFEKAGGIPKILGMYGPKEQREFLGKGEYKIEYLDYNWGLNDQGGTGNR